jgi:hypothetical protein
MNELDVRRRLRGQASSSECVAVAGGLVVAGTEVMTRHLVDFVDNDIENYMSELGLFFFCHGDSGDSHVGNFLRVQAGTLHVHDLRSERSGVLQMAPTGSDTRCISAVCQAGRQQPHGLLCGQGRLVRLLDVRMAGTQPIEAAGNSAGRAASGHERALAHTFAVNQDDVGALCVSSDGATAVSGDDSGLVRSYHAPECRFKSLAEETMISGGRA